MSSGGVLKFLWKGGPYFGVVIILPFVVKEIQSVRYKYSSAKGIDKFGEETQKQLKELGFDPDTQPTLDQVYEDYRHKLAEAEDSGKTWKNIRGPRAWEDNKGKGSPHLEHRQLVVPPPPNKSFRMGEERKVEDQLLDYLEGDDPRLPSVTSAAAAAVPAAAAAATTPRLPADGEETVEERPVRPPSASPSPQSAKRWSADPELLAQITGLGFSSVAAEKALFYTSNDSADAAVGWILDNPGAADDARPLLFEGFSSGESGDADDADAFVSGDQLLPAERARMMALAHKMVFVVNGSLKMGLGKAAAQVGHATLGLYRELLGRGGPDAAAALAAWQENGETKVVLRADTEEEMRELRSKAEGLRIAVHEIRDAGLTQIPSGSFTVLSLFADEERMDQVTGKLKLLD